MKTLLFLLFTLSLNCKAQYRKEQHNSLQLAYNTTYKSIGLQYNRFLKNYSFQIETEIRANAYNRASFCFGRIIETKELKVSLNAGVAYVYNNEFKTISPEIAEFTRYKRAILTTLTPEIGINFIMNKVVFSYHTDLNNFVGYSRLGLGIAF